MSQGKLKIPEADFWSEQPLKNRDAIEDPLMAQQKDALFVDAPLKVPIDVRKTVPVIALRIAHTQAVMGAPSPKFLLAVARELGSGRVRVGIAIPPSEKMEPDDEPPREADPKSMTSEMLRLDLRERLDLPWRPARFRAALILREEISDDLDIELDQSPGSFRDDAVEKHRREEALKAPPPELHPAPQPGKPFPAYGKVEGAPDAGNGLALAGPRVVKFDSKGTLIVKGSFKVEVPEHLLATTERPLKLVDGKAPGALVPITLVVTGSVRPAPVVYNMIVPSFDVEKGVASGSFAIDLDAAGPVRQVERTIFVYAFSGAARFGPLPIALVEE